jgi:hypothetical protein
VFAGFRDSCVYIDGTGNSAASPPTPPTLGNISGCRFYHSTSDVSIKAGADAFIHVSNCQSENVWKSYGIDHQATNGRPGARNVTFTNCTTSNFFIGFEVAESVNTAIIGCRAINVGHLDWDGSLRGSSGKVTLTGGASGSVSGITVNAVAIMSGTVNFTTDLETTALAVASNINAHTSTPNYVASVYETSAGSDDWVISIHTTADGAEVDGDTVAVTATTITTSTENMTYISAPGAQVSTALYIDGSTGTYVSGFDVSATAAHASQVSTQRSGLAMRAVDIRSMTAAASSTGGTVQSLDNTISGIRIQGVTDVGGEFNVSGPANPNRTHIRDVVIATDVTDQGGFAVLGAASHVDYGERRRKMLTADVTRTSDTTLAGNEVTEFTWTLPNAATFRVTGVLFVSGAVTGDAKCGWNAPAGTHLGYWHLQGPNLASTAQAGSVYNEAVDWSDFIEFGTHALETGGSACRVEGILETVAGGDWVLQFAQRVSDGTATTMYKYSWIEFERIG